MPVSDALAEDLSDVGLGAEIACVKRELAMRTSAYGKWVASGRMKQVEADKELRRMRAVLKRLMGIQQEGRLL